MAGFPTYLFTPCPCLHRSSGRSDLHLKGLHRFKQRWRFFSQIWFLFALICIVLSDRQEWSDFVRPWGMWGRGWFNISHHPSPTLWRNTTWMWFYHELTEDLTLKRRGSCIALFPLHTTRFLLPWWHFTFSKKCVSVALISIVSFFSAAVVGQFVYMFHLTKLRCCQNSAVNSHHFVVAPWTLNISSLLT